MFPIYSQDFLSEKKTENKTWLLSKLLARRWFACIRLLFVLDFVFWIKRTRIVFSDV